ncbi:MAG: hypothetical protein ACP5E5_15220 [Acidobacteriaceae bacterium]
MSKTKEYVMLTQRELDALEGKPPVVMALYVSLKRHMDYQTGIVGRTRKISWMTLRSALHVEPHSGMTESGTPSRFRVARIMAWLEKAGLVEDLGTKERGEPIMFRLPLALDADHLAGRDPAPNPAPEAEQHPAQEGALSEAQKSSKKTNGCSSNSEKAEQQPAQDAAQEVAQHPAQGGSGGFPAGLTATHSFVQPIVFKSVYAYAGWSVQKQPAQNPHRTRTGYPAQGVLDINLVKTDACEAHAAEPAQSEKRKSPDNPHDIINHYSLGNIYSNSISIPSGYKKDTSSLPERPALSAQVRDVFAQWQRIMNKPRAKLDRKRQTRIEWALKTYGYDACILAIEGCARSEWHMGKNDRGERYDDLTLIFRNAEKFERFLEYRNQEPKASPVSSTLQRWMGADAIEGEVIRRTVGG